LFASYAPFLYKTTSASFTPLLPVWIDRLLALGYFHGWDTRNGKSASAPAKVGLLYPNRQPQQRIFAQLKSQLTAKGIQVVKDFQYDATSLDRESTDMSNAVLQFRSAGVTHVLSSESDVLLFMTAADSQHYRPRYGLNSYHAPAVQLQGTVPATQLVGSMGVGWLPITDVDAGHNPGSVGPGEKRCRQIMHNASQDIRSSATAVVAFALCDGVHMVVQGASALGSPSAQGLRDGLSRVGASFESALTWRSGLSRRYDLPGAVRDFRYDNGAYHYLSTQNRPL
jgi:ABC-type branched-subunit amino acid transport system substrate-binding protein